MAVQACGICGSDLDAWSRRYQPVPGLSPGHEFAGTVLQSTAPLPDRLYTASPLTACAHCQDCESGSPQHCKSLQIIGIHRDGAFADTVDVPVRNLVAVGDGVDPLVASMAEPVAVVTRAIGLAGAEVGSRVLVLGAGAIGLIATLLLRERAGTIGVVARYPHQRELVSRFSATAVSEGELAAWGDEYEPDVVIITVGGGLDINQAIRAARPGGRIVLLSVLGERSIDFAALLTKELSLIGSHAYGSNRRGPEFVAAADVLGRYSAELAALQTHQFPLDDVQAAFELASDKTSGAVKATIVRGKGGRSADGRAVRGC
jgi:threonine dehydrogenase-like Zn-dependent dehydrogenase